MSENENTNNGNENNTGKYHNVIDILHRGEQDEISNLLDESLHYDKNKYKNELGFNTTISIISMNLISLRDSAEKETRESKEQIHDCLNFLVNTYGADKGSASSLESVIETYLGIKNCLVPATVGK